MDKDSVDKFIQNNYDKIINTNPDKDACPSWMVKWYNRFKKAAAKNKGYKCIRFMRKFRNIILQPLGIKYKGDKFIK